VIQVKLIIKGGKTALSCTSSATESNFTNGFEYLQKISFNPVSINIHFMENLIMEITELKSEEISGAVNLIKNVFDDFLAADYSDEGVSYFYERISVKSLMSRLSNGSTINIIKHGNRIVGFIEIINVNHIYLLFVAKEFQRNGLGGKLVKYSLDLLKKKNQGLTEVTVNSTIYALGLYKKLGFISIADFQLKNGIISYPMKIILS